MNAPQKIIGLIYVHENQALSLVSQFWCEAFQRHSPFETEVINLHDAAGAGRLSEALRTENVAFCFGLQGVGSRLTMPDGQSIWTHFKTPFLGLHYDNPSCNIYNHFCDSRYVANVYAFECLYDIQKRFIKSKQINAHVPFEIEACVIRGTPFRERPIPIVFMKSGKSPAPYANQISQVKQPLRDALWAAIAKAEKNENLVICDLLTEAFTSCGHDPALFWAEFWGFADWIDNYIRCKRAMDMVNVLKHIEGAVIVGNGWDFIDKTGSKAVFRTSIPAVDGLGLYGQTKFMCNTSPYGNDIIHERIFVGLSFYNYVVSDTNAWWDKNFADVPALARFNWGEDYAAEIRKAIRDPEAEAKVESGLGGQRVTEKLSGRARIPKIIDIARQVHDFAQSASADKA